MPQSKVKDHHCAHLGTAPDPIGEIHHARIAFIYVLNCYPSRTMFR